jgi:hypothetical protein
MRTKTFILFDRLLLFLRVLLEGFAFEMAKTAAGLPIRLDSARWV